MKKSIGTATLLAIICLALMPIAPAYAVNWIYVGESSHNAVYFYDADTIRRSGNQVTFWEKTDNSRDKTVKYREQKALRRVDCAERTFALIQATEYYSNGKTEHYSWAPSEQKNNFIVPESIMEAMLEAVCQ